VPALRGLSYREVVRVLAQDGWVVVRTAGGHAILDKPGALRPIPVPLHGEIGPGLMSRILREAGMRREEFARRL